MAIKPISKLPDPIQPLSNDDYLMLSVFNPDSGGQLSVKYTLGQLKDYVMGGATQISCDGATDQAWFTDGSGSWDIEVNNVSYNSPDGWGLGYFLHQTPELAELLQANGDGDCIVSSKTTEMPLRIKLIRKDSDRWEINEANTNPTIIIDENGDISFCLAPAGCQPTTVFINPDSSELGALTGVSYAVSYQLDDGVTSGEMQTAVFHIEPYDHENTATYSRLLEAMANAVGLSYHGGGGGSWPWSIGYSQGAGFNMISGGDGSVNSLPQTLKLFLSTSPSIDAVQVLFGDAVTVHSCGAQNYPGV